MPGPLTPKDKQQEAEQLRLSEAPSADASSLTGAQLSHYQIAEQLGKGGMGTLYRAKHVVTNKIVAVKVLHPWLCQNETAMRRFQQEARAASTLAHQNAIALHHFDLTESGAPYLVMDLVDGESLSVLIETNGALPIARAVPIFEQICAALAHAHGKGVIHRDVKPSNIMIARGEQGEDHVKLVDFGIAKLTHADGPGVTTITETGALVGSPAYMSPEQCRGLKVDIRSDLYSLGCVMYQTLSGALPHGGESQLDTIYRHINDTAAPLNSIGTHEAIPAALETIVNKAMAKDPGRRYQTAAQLSEDLASFLEHKPITHARRSATPGANAQLRAVLSSLIVAIVLLGSAAVVVHWLTAFTDPYVGIDPNKQCVWLAPPAATGKKNDSPYEPKFVRANKLYAAGNWVLADKSFAAAQKAPEPFWDEDHNRDIFDAKWADCWRLSRLKGDPDLTNAYKTYEILTERFEEPLNKAFCIYHMAQMDATDPRQVARASREFSQAIELARKSTPLGAEYSARMAADYGEFLWRTGSWIDALQMRRYAYDVLKPAALESKRFPLGKP